VSTKPSPSPAISQEKKLELLIGSVRDYAIFMLDEYGRVQTWNLGARTIKGYLPEEIIGHSIDRFYTEEDRLAGLPAKLLKLARDEGRVENEGWRVRKDGTRFFADVIITALRDEHGALVGYAKVTRDLTEKRRAEELRFESEQRFRFLVDSVRDYAIFMLDPRGNVATWNPGAARIKGYRADEIVGSHFSRFYPPEALAAGAPERELAVALSEGKFEEEGWRLRSDGTRFWASVVITPVISADAEHIGFVKVTRDLTERREADLERLRLAQAQEAIRLRDDFLSIASHELRTPLMAVQLQIESLQRMYSGTDDKLGSKLDRADRGVRRLSDLVDALLDVTRISSGKLTVHATQVDLAAVIDEVLDRMHEAVVQSGCKLTARIERGIVGNWDPLRMGQVVTNLLSNAIKYAAGSDVEVVLRRDGDLAKLVVSDTGPGIPPKDLERVFGRFERAADSRHHGGLGLGLYVAREIVVAHGGAIHATNREPSGALFEIDLPVRGLKI
jgi:PAS domain S-box-containing protein